MPVYQNQGPQQYAMHQQNRKDDWIRQLLQMFMMKQRQGRQDERWEQEHELSQRRTKAYETTVKTQADMAKRPKAPPKPTAQDQKWAIIDGLVERKLLTPDQGDKLKAGMGKPEKPEAGIPQSVDPKFKAHLIKTYGTNWRTEMSYDDFKDIRNEWQIRTRPKGPEKPTTAPTVTPTSKLTSRRIISSAVNKTFIDIQNIDPKHFEDPEQIEAYRLRADVDIDMPPKYTKIKRYMEQDLAKPEEIEYFNKATEAKDLLDEPEFADVTDISQLPAETVKDYGRDILQSILSLRKKKRKKFLGVL